jgi:transcriptional regulator with XRE-family HTH domain
MIYKNVKTIADKKGLSICEIEKKAGIANGTVGGWKKSSPNIKSLAAVAKVLEVSINDLLNGII